MISSSCRQPNYLMTILGILICLVGGIFLMPQNVKAQEQDEYIKDHVILTGSGTQIDAGLLSELQSYLRQNHPDANVNIQRLGRIELNSWISSTHQWVCTNGLAPIDLVADLYEINTDPEGEATDWTQAVLSANTVWSNANNIFISPNYITGDPHIFSGNANPLAAGAVSNEYWGQWAFSNANGIGLSNETGRYNDFLYNGSGITIGLFDTSPYATEGVHQFQVPPLDLSLNVSLPPMFVSRTVTDTSSADHGLFVAGVAHGVAPAANIHLYRVLEGDNKGNLFALSNALNMFIKDRNPSDPTIINLSLGLYIPDSPPSDTSCINGEGPLKTILYAARDIKNIVSVGAAGNDSGLPVQLPAAWNVVAGAAGSRLGKILAGYSNQLPDGSNNVTAPGGHYTDPLIGCTTNPTDCIVGPVLSPTPGYGYWAGTSFGTAMSSGLAALLMEKAIAQNGSSNAAQIVGEIAQTVVPGTNGQGRGAGVIDLRCDGLVAASGSSERECPSGPPTTLSIPTNIAAAAGQIVSVPINFTSSANEEVASSIFSVNFDENCLSFNPVDNNQDDIPDVITFNIPNDFVASVIYEAADTDGELDFALVDPLTPLAILPDSTIATIEFTTACNPGSGSTQIASVNFSTMPPTSFGSTTGVSLNGTTTDGSVEIYGDQILWGDCNGDNLVDAGDISCIILEIFDGDGSNPADAPGGSHGGTPRSDANNDIRVDAADIACTVLLIFDGPGSCTLSQ